MRGYLRLRDRRDAKTKKAERLKAHEQRWSLVVDAGYKVNGKRQQRYRSFAGTREQAEAKLRAFIDEVKSGVVMDEKLLTADYLARWLQQKRSEGLASGTLSRYEGIVRDSIAPVLGSIPIAKLAVVDVKKALSEWRDAPRKDRKSGKLSDRTIHHIFSTLKSALADAVRDEAVKRNVCAAVRTPSKGHSHVRAIDETAALALLDFLDETPLGLPTRIALLTGLRRAELLALRWGDLDLDGCMLHVRRSLEVVKGEQGAEAVRFKTPLKTKKSRRPIALPAEEAVAVLRAHRVALGKQRLELGIPASEDDLVFPEPDPLRWSPARPWNPDRFSSAFYYRVSKSGLPKVSFHGLRHSFASISLRAGVPLKVVSEALGHTTIAITADLYTEVLGDLQRQAADKIDDVFDRARARRASGDAGKG
jgi:integrase